MRSYDVIAMREGERELSSPECSEDIDEGTTPVGQDVYGTDVVGSVREPCIYWLIRTKNARGAYLQSRVSQRWRINDGRSYDATSQQHAQGLRFLMISGVESVVGACHGSFAAKVSGRKPTRRNHGGLHPKDTTKLLVEFLGALTLDATRQQTLGPG
ncbi:MAG: hypothetical protein K0S45_3895 [Nitrospira sp.]|jgi:hypothetical protein|nr:hypothetical protein [Nitrospira sp.]